MNKEIFIAVCDRLKTEVPQLRWIDAEEGQLNTGERPAVAFPCCLIDISYPSCETHMGGRQKIKAQMQLRVAFQAGGGVQMRQPLNLSGNTLSPAWTRWIRYTRLCNGGTAGTFSTRCAASGVRRKKEWTV